MDPVSIPIVLNSEEILSRIPADISLEIEIGCGNGHFLSEYCQKNQGSYLIGIEWKKKRCLKALKKIERKKLINACIIQCRAEDFLPEIPENRVSRYHIYFPDPWPKNKHRKRRFLRMANLERIYASLKKKGTILFATDFFDYYLQFKLLSLIHQGLELSPERPPEEIFSSVYGKKFKDLGKEVYITAFRKKLVD